MNKANLYKRMKFIRMLAVFTLFLGIGAITIAMLKIQSDIAQYSIYSTQYVLDQNITIQQLQETETELKNNSVVIKPVEPLVEYPLNPELGDHFGDMSIPILGIKVPLIQGTNFDALEKGVGHYINSVMPGVVDNCVLAGHRDTVFKQLGELQLEDQLIVTTAAGIFTYVISNIRIVDADDLTVIVPSKTAILTLSTCYPFNTPGYYPQRYIVSADLAVIP